MKILLITEFFPTGKDLKFSGGVEARSFFLAKYLSKNHQIIVITSRVVGSPKKEKMFNFTVFRVGKIRKYSPTVGNLLERLYFIKEAIKAGKTIEADVVDASNFISHFIAKRISQDKKIPVVAWYADTWIGSWVKNAGLYGIFGEILERINFASGFDTYIAISKETSKKLRKHTKKQIRVIPCGVDLEEFKFSHQKFSDPTVITISRLAKYKNLRTLIFAFALFLKKVKNAKLIIIGSGPYFSKLVNLINALKLTSKVTFHSNLPRKRLIEILKSSHVFCLPSAVEGFGIAVIEAAAAGLPYVISNIPVFKEITNGGSGGFLFRLQDIKDLEFKLERLFVDKKLYEKKSKEAKKLVREYRWENVARETEKVYSSLLS